MGLWARYVKRVNTNQESEEKLCQDNSLGRGVREARDQVEVQYTWRWMRNVLHQSEAHPLAVCTFYPAKTKLSLYRPREERMEHPVICKRPASWRWVCVTSYGLSFSSAVFSWPGLRSKFVEMKGLGVGNLRNSLLWPFLNLLCCEIPLNSHHIEGLVYLSELRGDFSDWVWHAIPLLNFIEVSFEFAGPLEDARQRQYFYILEVQRDGAYTAWSMVRYLANFVSNSESNSSSTYKELR